MTLRIALVSEHASPLAVHLGTADAGGQNVYVDALARHLARVGAVVDVYTRRDDPSAPAVRDLAAGVRVHNVSAGPPEPIPKDDLFDLMPEFARRLERCLALATTRRRARPLLDVGLGQPACRWRTAFRSCRRSTRSASSSGAIRGPRTPALPSATTSSAACCSASTPMIATCLDEVSELVALGGDAAKITVVPCGVDNRFQPTPDATAALRASPASGGWCHARASPT